MDAGVLGGADADGGQGGGLSAGGAGSYRLQGDVDAHGGVVAGDDVEEIAELAQYEIAAFGLGEHQTGTGLSVGAGQQHTAPVDAAVAALPFVGGQAGDAGNGPDLKPEGARGRQAAGGRQVGGDAAHCGGDAHRGEAVFLDDVKGGGGDVNAGPAAVEVVGGDDGSAAAAERVQHQAVLGAGGRD